jgi:hypothetical protein
MSNAVVVAIRVCSSGTTAPVENPESPSVEWYVVNDDIEKL